MATEHHSLHPLRCEISAICTIDYYSIVPSLNANFFECKTMISYKKHLDKKWKLSHTYNRLYKGSGLMFFSFIRGLIYLIILLLNGKPEYQGREKLPKDDNYIIIAPHRSWIDPVYLAFVAAPKQFAFMAKK